jgi:hypothetical protein
VPEFARIGDKNQVCEVKIGSPPFALGAFVLTFHLGMTDQDELGREVGTIVANDLALTALIIQGVLENGTQMIELAQENDLVFRVPPQLSSSLDTTARRQEAPGGRAG